MSPDPLDIGASTGNNLTYLPPPTGNNLTSFPLSITTCITAYLSGHTGTIKQWDTFTRIVVAGNDVCVVWVTNSSFMLTKCSCETHLVFIALNLCGFIYPRKFLMGQRLLTSDGESRVYCICGSSFNIMDMFGPPLFLRKSSNQHSHHWLFHCGCPYIYLSRCSDTVVHLTIVLLL